MVALLLLVCQWCVKFGIVQFNDNSYSSFYVGFYVLSCQKPSGLKVYPDRVLAVVLKLFPDLGWPFSAGESQVMLFIKVHTFVSKLFYKVTL